MAVTNPFSAGAAVTIEALRRAVNSTFQSFTRQLNNEFNNLHEDFEANTVTATVRLNAPYVTTQAAFTAAQTGRQAGDIIITSADFTYDTSETATAGLNYFNGTAWVRQ